MRVCDGGACLCKITRPCLRGCVLGCAGLSVCLCLCLC